MSFVELLTDLSIAIPNLLIWNYDEKNVDLHEVVETDRNMYVTITKEFTLEYSLNHNSDLWCIFLDNELALPKWFDQKYKVYDGFKRYIGVRERTVVEIRKNEKTILIKLSVAVEKFKNLMEQI